MQKPASRTASTRRAIAFIFAVVLIDSIAVGIIIPVLPKLVEAMLAGDTPRAAEIFGLFGTAWAVMQFFSAPVLGALSDQVGRRPVLLISMAGNGLDYVLMALAPNLAWLFVGRIISGITSASYSTAFAYLADVTEPDKRAQAFGIVGAAFGVGFVIGPALGGLMGALDPRLPFWVAAGFSFANAAYGYFVLPESLAGDKRMVFQWRRANPVGSLRLLHQRRELLGLGGVVFLYYLAHAVLPAVAVLYASYRYGFDATTMGLTLAAVGVAMGLVQGTMIQPVIRQIGLRATLLVGLLCGVAGFAIYGLATTAVGFWLGIPVMAFWGLSGAAFQAMMSQMVGPSEQGQLQGASSSIMALAGLLGPGLFTQVFAVAIAPDAQWQLPGAPFLLAALLLLLGTALAWRVTQGSPAAARAGSPPAATG
jgi:DHA1 family tetracycline resistance protein-like MFS transporter